MSRQTVHINNREREHLNPPKIHTATIGRTRTPREGRGDGGGPSMLLTLQAVDGKALKLHQRDAFRGGLQVELQAVRVQLPPVPGQPRLPQPRSTAGELHLPRTRA